jgi:hypothetical protein
MQEAFYELQSQVGLIMNVKSICYSVSKYLNFKIMKVFVIIKVFRCSDHEI